MDEIAKNVKGKKKYIEIRVERKLKKMAMKVDKEREDFLWKEYQNAKREAEKKSKQLIADGKNEKNAKLEAEKIITKNPFFKEWFIRGFLPDEYYK